jgi:hypothetical protein
MDLRHAIAWGIAGALIAGGLLPAAWHPAAPSWTEVTWPHPLDAWPAGRAFTCPAGRCGAEVRMAIRPKIGFCNCSTGVADDDEIDRVGDLVVFGQDYAPDGSGWPMRIGGLVGRTRRYLVKEIGGRKLYALGLAVAAHCDVVVGTIESDWPIAAETENAAFDFLAGEPVRSWAEKAVSEP